MISRDKIFSFYISPLYVKQSDKIFKFSKKCIKLRDFQNKLLEIFKNYNEKNVVLLNAPTGSGKTFTLLIPLLANIESDYLYFGSVGVYPSKELAKDQMNSVANLLNEIGAYKVDVKDFFKELNALSDEDVKVIEDFIKLFAINTPARGINVILIYITSDSLKKLRGIINKYIPNINNNRELLRFLWNQTYGDVFRIIFTVPEYPYLLATDVYQDFHSAGVWLHSMVRELNLFLRSLRNNNYADIEDWFKKLESKIGRKVVFKEFYTSREFLNNLAEVYLLFRAPIFFDEFHLYSGFSLASFISLLWIYMYEKGIGKIVISSATPKKTILIKGKQKDLLTLIEEMASNMGYTFVKVSSETSSDKKPGFEQVRKKTLMKVVPIMLHGGDFFGPSAYGRLQRYVKDVIKESSWVDEYKMIGRSMIIVDRLASVMEIAIFIKEFINETPLVVTSSKILFSDLFQSPNNASLRDAKIIVGNMAIAFGLDIKGMDLGIVAAKDYLSAIQKIGRYGRGAGNEVAIIYSMIPYYIYTCNQELINNLNGKEISYMDFIKVIKKLYPKDRSDVFIKSYIGVFKLLLPAWTYVIATMIRLRSEIKEKLNKAKKVDDVAEINDFLKLLNNLGSFIECENLREKLIATITKRLNLTPIGLHDLYSLRNVTGIIIKRYVNDTVFEETLNLPVAGRNFPLEYSQGEFIIREGSPAYEYTTLWLGIDKSKEDISRKLLNLMDGYVVTFRLLIEVLSDLILYQGDDRLCKVTTLDKEIDLWESPILILNASKENRKKFIKSLSATESVIPIYTVNTANNKVEPTDLIGGIYIL